MNKIHTFQDFEIFSIRIELIGINFSFSRFHTHIHRTWTEGKIMVFDDSFEHEVWHNGTTYRLILIVDVWHPDLTAHEKKTLVPI